MKRLLLVLTLLAMSGVWPGSAQAWQWKRTTVVFDTTTSVGPATQFFTSAVASAGAELVVFRIFSSDTCSFCGDSTSLGAVQMSFDGTNWGPVAGVKTLSNNLTSATDLKRSSGGGGGFYTVFPSYTNADFDIRYLAAPFIRLVLTSTNHANYTNRYRIEATVYIDQ